MSEAVVAQSVIPRSANPQLSTVAFTPVTSVEESNSHTSPSSPIWKEPLVKFRDDRPFLGNASDPLVPRLGDSPFNESCGSQSGQTEQNGQVMFRCSPGSEIPRYTDLGQISSIFSQIDPEVIGNILTSDPRNDFSRNFNNSWMQLSRDNPHLRSTYDRSFIAAEEGADMTWANVLERFDELDSQLQVLAADALLSRILTQVRTLIIQMRSLIVLTVLI